MSGRFSYLQIQGFRDSAHLTTEFIEALTQIAERIETRTEYLPAAMSFFETGDSRSPSIQNRAGRRRAASWAIVIISNCIDNPADPLMLPEKIKAARRFSAAQPA